MKYFIFVLFVLFALPLFSQNADPELEEKDLIMYYKGEDEPYTGPVVGYYENGQKGKEGKYIEGRKEGTWTWWYDDGQKKREGEYTKSKKTGLWIDWYKSGEKRLAMNYKDGNQHGESGWWYENGNKKKITIYKYGVFQTKKEWNIDGTLKQSAF